MLTTNSPAPALSDLDFKPYEASGFRLYQVPDISDAEEFSRNWLAERGALDEAAVATDETVQRWEIGLKRWPWPHLTARLRFRSSSVDLAVLTQPRLARLTQPLGEVGRFGLVALVGVVLYALAFVLDVLLIPLGLLLGKRFSARDWLNERDEMP